MTQLLLFKFSHDDHLDNIRTVDQNGEILFVASDVTKALGYANASKAITDHCKEKGITKRYPLQTKGGEQLVTLINEGNLYRLIVKSQLPAAERFEDWIFGEVIPSIRKTGGYSINRVEPSNFVLRYFENYNRVPKGTFSVITELYVRLYARFEHNGYKIPNKAWDGREIRPDTSIGKMFANYLRDNYPSAPTEFQKYVHKFPSGVEVEARLYPIDLVSIFITYVDDVWIPQHAEKYFYERDRKALDYLPKLLTV